MKNEKGFTLIELLGVVVILAVIMMLAIPNVVNTINKNKKDALIEDAKKFKAAVESKIASDTSIQKPTADTAVVFMLGKVGNLELSESPYGTVYSKTKSFIVVTKEPKTVTVDNGNTTQSKTYSELVYYVQLVTCETETCEDENVDARHGINLQKLKDLNNSDRFNMVVEADEVRLIDPAGSGADIKSVVGDKILRIY